MSSNIKVDSLFLTSKRAGRKATRLMIKNTYGQFLNEGRSEVIEKFQFDASSLLSGKFPKRYERTLRHALLKVSYVSYINSSNGEAGIYQPVIKGIEFFASNAKNQSDFKKLRKLLMEKFQIVGHNLVAVVVNESRRRSAS